ILFLFLMQFRHEVLNVSRKILFILLIIFLFVLISKILTFKYGRDFIFIVPFAIIPVIIRTFYDSRLALFILLVTIMLSSLMILQPFEFILMSFISGMAAIFTLTNIYKRTRLFFTAASVILTLSVLYLGLCLMRDGNLHKFLLSDLIMFGVNGIFVLLSYPLIIIFEQRFLLISETSLLELSDTNQPLLRKFAEEAPGSFQHSLQVANLAEEAARAIGGHLLLVRAGALYHDIGKIANPSYYIENQAEGVSPHESLSPGESSRVIINHVKNGVVLAKNYKLPVQIIDFIRTHHGTTVAYYFYKKYIDQNPGKTEMGKEFAYPGPKPFSKETAVVMMADAVEASSRSLGKYTEEGISELVERILYLQEQDGQFSDVPLTFKDISDIKAVFKRRLLNIYHARIAYPERG
ncbi:MAG TPA: HDIG domain-containing protein, partial [Bacteroidales bacterium]|nr:HDIG domain-containing protein [Bacteroidales bacterium]